MLPNAAQEQRAREIGRQLRCLVCQNESIEDSGADLARDLRHIVRQQVAAGRDEAQVIDYVHQRYGDFVLLRPPFDRATLLLWATPALALLAGLIAVFVSRRRRATEAPPLTEAERARLARLEDGTHA